ncbi:hypothetical protein V5738_15445 [Salinisphaera sp. SPP-AMP-43]|uniref:hypothetical protein n=1 Tax=Salinisphaera sp. SPP-AMP-43 TaxID=3121288 RepID=UPI003C6E832F
MASLGGLKPGARRINQLALSGLGRARTARCYRRLGFSPIVDARGDVRVECPENSATWSLMRNPCAPANGAILYCEHDSLDYWVARQVTDSIERAQRRADQLDRGRETNPVRACRQSRQT